MTREHNCGGYKHKFINVYLEVMYKNTDITLYSISFSLILARRMILVSLFYFILFDNSIKI